MKSHCPQTTAPQASLINKIPTEHELLPPSSVAPLEVWLLKELEALESQFATFVRTPTNQGSLGR
ncbi:MAG: hypothetical protein GY768_25595 [Planctomycetaceae bacterium]|nr:hypothetical protein [Planctomycetaceae bacterium]